MTDNVIDIDYPAAEMLKDDCILYADRYHISNSRMASGLVMSASEYEDFRRRVYSTPLP